MAKQSTFLGFFSKKEEEDKQINLKIKRLIEFLERSEKYKYKDNALEYLKYISDQQITLYDFGNEDITYSTIQKIVQKGKDFNYSLSMAKQLYDLIVYDVTNEDQKTLFYSFLNLSLQNESYFQNQNEVNNIFNVFNNKKHVLSIFNYFIDNNYLQENVSLIFDYLKKARRYYVDEYGLYSSFLELIENVISCLKNKKEINKLVEIALKKDANMAGLYPGLEESEIYALSVKMDKINAGVSSCEERISKVDYITTNFIEIVTKKIDEIISAKTQDFARKYIEAKSYIESVIESIGKTGNASQTEIRNLAEKYLDTLNKLLGLHPDLKEKLQTVDSGVPMSSVSECFDLKIDYDTRLKKVISSKKSEELYHDGFDMIVQEVLLRKPVCLVGPSGAGKTLTIYQMAECLKLPLCNLGYITDEFSSIKGYMDAQGEFVSTPFYQAFKYGEILFVDEIDNSESKALIELNKIIGGKTGNYLPYKFPNGELVYPHPNFTIVAAANTWGNGGSSQYNTREKMDSTTVDRFQMIKYGYDIKLEAAILKDYPEMFKFAMAYRKALKDSDSQSVFSTRTISNIAECLGKKSFTIEHILETRFLREDLERPEVMNLIFKNLNDSSLENNEIFKVFEGLVSKVTKRVMKR